MVYLAVAQSSYDILLNPLEPPPAPSLTKVDYFTSLELKWVLYINRMLNGALDFWANAWKGKSPKGGFSIILLKPWPPKSKSENHTRKHILIQYPLELKTSVKSLLPDKKGCFSLRDLPGEANGFCQGFQA